jgi:hypothetical protein
MSPPCIQDYSQLMHHLATLLLLHCCLYIAIAACSMEALKRDHGAIGYLDSLVDGPGPVMQMLRDHAGVHTVILGSGDTEAQLSSNPQLLDKLARGQSGNGCSGAVFTIRPAGRGSKPFIQVTRHYCYLLLSNNFNTVVGAGAEWSGV